MKRLEITVRFRRKYVKVVRESAEHLTAEQKYTVMLALIGCTALLGFLYLFLVCGLRYG